MIRGTIQYQRSPGATAKLLRAAMAVGNAAAVEHWNEKFRPLHFTVSGGRRYGFKPRKGDNEPPRLTVRADTANSRGRTIANPHYSWRKRREKRHNKPLVWSGRSELLSKVMRVSATSRRGVGAFVALPKYFYQYRTDLNQPDKAAELTTTVHDEVAALAVVARDAALKHLEAQRVTETVRAA
jgi:hypothetical protein